MDPQPHDDKTIGKENFQRISITPTIDIKYMKKQKMQVVPSKSQQRLNHWPQPDILHDKKNKTLLNTKNRQLN